MRLFIQRLGLLSIASSVSVLVACSASSTSTPPAAGSAKTTTEETDGENTGSLAVELSDVSAIPLTTYPVFEGEAGAAVTTKSGTLELPLAATEGIPLGNADGTVYSSDSPEDGGLGDAFEAKASQSVRSYGACETTRVARNMLTEAASADQVLCMLKMAKAEITDAYDGNYHVYGLSFGEENLAGMDHFRVKFVMSGDSIQEFHMQGCYEGAQGMAVKMVVDDSASVRIDSMFRDTSSGSTSVGMGHIAVDGTLSTDGLFVGTKTITSRFENDFSENGLGTVDGHSKTIAIQTPTTLSINRYYTNMPDFGSGSASAQRFYAYVDLLDHNTTGKYRLGKLAIGDGAYLGYSGDQYGVQGWDGDSWLITSGDSTQKTYVKEHAGDVLAVQSSRHNLAFSEIEDYDCSETATKTIVLDPNEAFESCGVFMLPQGYVECSAIATQPSYDQ